MTEAVIVFLLARLRDLESAALSTQADLAARNLNGTLSHLTAAGRHVIVYDPAAVLAQVQAQRAVVERWQLLRQPRSRAPIPTAWSGWDEIDRAALRRALDWAIRSAAAAWSDHPAYEKAYQIS